MHLHTYLEEVSQHLALYHELCPNHTWQEKKYDLYAYFFQRNERYIASKKTVIYGIEANRHLFIKHHPNLSVPIIQQEINHLTSDLQSLIRPHDEHMSSLLELTLLTEGPVSSSMIQFIQQSKFYKSFWFGLHGWVHLGLLLVDLSNHKIYSNPKGKEDQSIFRASFEVFDKNKETKGVTN